jgi:hypothetical protein
MLVLGVPVIVFVSLKTSPRHWLANAYSGPIPLFSGPARCNKLISDQLHDLRVWLPGGAVGAEAGMERHCERESVPGEARRVR